MDFPCFGGACDRRLDFFEKEIGCYFGGKNHTGEPVHSAGEVSKRGKAKLRKMGEGEKLEKTGLEIVWRGDGTASTLHLDEILSGMSLDELRAQLEEIRSSGTLHRASTEEILTVVENIRDPALRESIQNWSQIKNYSDFTIYLQNIHHAQTSFLCLLM